MERRVLRQRLHLSGMDSRAADMARVRGLGFEITEFCWAPRLEQPDAMALVRRPSLLILDEPVTGLDPASMQDLYKTLRYLNEREGMAIIMVTHDIENALREAKHILCVDRAGCFYGTVGEFLSSPAGKRFGGERA